MNPKRARSSNWEEEEKQLLCSVLKDYTTILEDKSLKTNTNKLKGKAWENVHKRFNELNSRSRDLSQLQIQWKKLKIDARKAHTTFNIESTKTGGGARPQTPNNILIEVKDLLNPAELLKDHNIYDSDWCSVTPNIEIIRETDDNLCIAGPSQDSVTESLQFENTCSQVTHPDVITPDTKNVDESEAITQSVNNKKRKIPPNTANTRSEARLKPPKVDDYKLTMVNHSKKIKEEGHQMRLQMEKELHKIHTKLEEEKLNNTLKEGKILDIKLENEEKRLQMEKELHKIHMKIQEEKLNTMLKEGKILAIKLEYEEEKLQMEKELHKIRTKIQEEKLNNTLKEGKI